MKTTADSMLKKNKEYTKLRSKQETPKPPREHPHDQAPGARGHRKPDYARWTDEELKAAAAELGAADVENRSRDELLEYLDANPR